MAGEVHSHNNNIYIYIYILIQMNKFTTHHIHAKLQHYKPACVYVWVCVFVYVRNFRWWKKYKSVILHSHWSCSHNWPLELINILIKAILSRSSICHLVQTCFSDYFHSTSAYKHENRAHYWISLMSGIIV